MASSASNEFGWNLISLLTKDKGTDNVFISPFSISVALAMTRLGARGETAAGMEKALFWKTDGDAIHKEFQNYITLLQKPNQSCILRTANRIYIEKGYPILEDFLKLTRELYQAEPVAANFNGSPDTERTVINQWVETQTEKKIQDLIPDGVLNNLTRMVLVNAIYFKGQWEHKFDKENTRPETFHISSSKNKSVHMMFLSKKLPYYKADDFAVLELPYQGGQLSMCVILPDKRFGLEALEQKLTVQKMKESFSNFASHFKVEVSLPTFEISSSFKMKQMLSGLGMAKAFDLNEADFSGMTGNQDLCISEVVHKAFLKVDEEGSEAAAATGVVMQMRCAMIQRSIEFRADHPFLVVIRDKTNDMVLFMGQVTEPSEPK